MTRKLELKLDHNGRPRFVGTLTPEEFGGVADGKGKAVVLSLVKMLMLMLHYRNPDDVPPDDAAAAWALLASRLAMDFVEGFSTGLGVRTTRRGRGRPKGEYGPAHYAAAVELARRDNAQITKDNTACLIVAKMVDYIEWKDGKNPSRRSKTDLKGLARNLQRYLPQGRKELQDDPDNDAARWLDAELKHRDVSHKK